MTDHTTQTLEREWRATGSMDARVRLLRAWGREGRETPPGSWSAALDLGAYLGDEACRELVPEFCRMSTKGEHCRCLGDHACCQCATEPNEPLGDWLSGLERWGHTAQVRAAVAVAREALGALKRVGEGNCCDIERVISAAEAWSVCPCRATEYAWVDVTPVPAARNHRWLPVPWWTPYYLDRNGQSVDGGSAALEAVRGKLLTDTQVRTAIRDALVPWALGEA